MLDGNAGRSFGSIDRFVSAFFGVHLLRGDGDEYSSDRLKNRGHGRFELFFFPGWRKVCFRSGRWKIHCCLDHFRRKITDELRCRSDSVGKERQLLHLAVAAASEKLVGFYPRIDVAEARPRVPSFYALELPRAVEGSLLK